MSFRQVAGQSVRGWLRTDWRIRSASCPREPGEGHSHCIRAARARSAAWPPPVPHFALLVSSLYQKIMLDIRVIFAYDSLCLTVASPCHSPIPQYAAATRFPGLPAGSLAGLSAELLADLSAVTVANPSPQSLCAATSSYSKLLKE